MGGSLGHLRRNIPGLLQPLLGLSRRYEVPTKQLVVDLRVIRMDCYCTIGVSHILEEIPLGQTAEDTGGLKDGKVKVHSQAAFVASVVRYQDWIHLIDV